MRIRNNSVAKFIASRRWIRRLNLFDLPDTLWVERKGKRLFLAAQDLKGPSYHVLNWGMESYEQQNVDFLKTYLSQLDSPCFIDVGANVGIFSFILASDLPELQVHMFEPERSAHGCLLTTFVPESFPQTQVYNFAVSDKESDVLLHSDGENHGGHSLHENMILEDGNSIHSAEIVTSVRLDTFLETKGIERFDVLKMDIQGHETEALRGAKAVLGHHRPLVLLECMISDLLKDNSGLLEPFINNDYQCIQPGTDKVFEVTAATIKNQFADEKRPYVDLAFVPKEKVNLL